MKKDRREAIKDRADENKKFWTFHKTVLNELVSISGFFGDTQKGQDKADREIVTFPDGGVTIGVEQTN